MSLETTIAMAAVVSIEDKCITIPIPSYVSRPIYENLRDFESMLMTFFLIGGI